MSRFEDTLQRDLHVIADRATPSPDAWSQIQSRIDDQDPIQETEIIMLTENTLTRKRWPLVAAAAAVVALAITGIALVNRGDGDEQPADVPTPTLAPAPDPETDDAATPVDVPTVTELPPEGTELAPGRYATTTFGVPVSFDVPESTGAPWTVQVNDDIAVTIGHDAGFLNMSRLGSLYDAEQSQDPAMSGLGSIAPDDIDTWIETNSVIVDDSQDVTIGGRPAKLRQVQAPEGSGQDSCPAEIQPCVSLSSASADLQDTYDGVSTAVYGQFSHTFWIVELGDFEPLGIWAHTETPDTQAWLDEVMPLIDSMVLGEPAPAIEGGQARLPRRHEFFATGTTPRGPGIELADGRIVRSGVTTVVGDLDGEISGVGVELTPANGFDELTFSGTIEGIGSGTLAMHQEWTGATDGSISLTTAITGGTGDFAGATGKVVTSLDQPDETGDIPIYTSRMTFQLTLPATPPTVEAPTPVAVQGTYDGVRTDGPALADGSATVTYTATTEGSMVGEIVGTGISPPSTDGDCTGSTEYVFVGTIEGVGTGILAYRDEWVSPGCAAGEATVNVTIAGGTGDFTGATGTGTTAVNTSVRTGADDMVAGTNTLTLVIPPVG